MHLGNALGVRAAPHPITLKRAGELGPGVFRGVHFYLRLGQPLALRDLGRRRHERRDRRRHALVALHHVISWDFGHLRGGPRLEGMRLVAFPIGALVVVVSTEKGVETLRRVQHVVVGAAGPLIVLVIFTRRAERREFGVEFVIGLSWTRQRGTV